MPGPRLPMRKIRDVLRLSAAGMSKRQIAAGLGVSATAAGDCIRRARRAGLGWPLPEGLKDEALEARLYPPPMSKPWSSRSAALASTAPLTASPRSTPASQTVLVRAAGRSCC